MLKYDANIEDLDGLEVCFLNSIKDGKIVENIEFMEICEGMCKDLITHYDDDEFEIECCSAYYRKIVHLIAKKYGLNSVRILKYVTSEDLCNSCGDGKYKTTRWKKVKVSKYPLEKTKGNEKSNKHKKQLEIRNRARQLEGLSPILQTPRKTLDEIKYGKINT